MPTAIERETQAIKSEAKKVLLIVLCISLVVYAFTGTAQISEEQTGLVVRLGKIIKTQKPGLYWGLPWPIDRVVRIPTGVAHSLQVNNFNLDTESVSAKLTELRQHERFGRLPGPMRSALAEPYLISGDLNAIHMGITVVYHISNPEDYYRAAGDAQDFSQSRVQDMARSIVANAMIQTVADKEVMTALTQAQELIQQRVQQISQEHMDRLKLGVTIRDSDAIRITTRRPPRRLQEVFDLVTTARDAKNYLINVARVQANQIENQAKAEVAEIEADAESYSQITIREAQGDAARFIALIKEFQAKGEVVRDRLRYEKLAEVAPYLKAPTMHAINDIQGKQKLVITIPGKPE